MDAIVRLFQPDVLVDHRIREIQQSALKAERSAGGDLLHQEVARILDRRQPIGVRPWGDAVA